MQDVWETFLNMLSKIDVNKVLPIILSGIGGILTSYFAGLHDSRKKDKTKLEYELKNIYLPIAKEMFPNLSPKQTDMETIKKICEFVYQKFLNEFEHVPPAHIRQIKLLQSYLQCYEQDIVLWDKTIHRKYTRLCRQVDVYINYLKRRLGYPNENLSTYLLTLTYSPKLAKILAFLILLIYFTFYIFFLLTDQFANVVFCIFLPLILIVLLDKGITLLNNRGGLRLALRNKNTRGKKDVIHIRRR